LLQHHPGLKLEVGFGPEFHSHQGFKLKSNLGSDQSLNWSCLPQNFNFTNNAWTTQWVTW